MAASTDLAKLFVFPFILLSILCQICNGAYHANVLFSGERLYKSESLNNGNYTFKLQDDCRVGLYDAGKRIWASSNAGFNRFCISSLDKDGSFIIYSKTLGLLWSAFSVLDDHPEGDYVLILQNDRNVVIYGPALWCALPDNCILPDDTNVITDPFQKKMITDPFQKKKGSLILSKKKSITDPFQKKRITDADIGCEADKGIVLYTDQRLSAGECLKFGRFALLMQRDCDLVLYDGDESIWSTKTGGRGQNCYLRLRGYDGNLVVYRPDFRELWTAFTSKKDDGNYVLVLQEYGGIAIYDRPIWSTGTNLANEIGAISFNNSTAEAITATNGVAAVL